MNSGRNFRAGVGCRKQRSDSGAEPVLLARLT
jgi:hypothetical protein